MFNFPNTPSSGDLFQPVGGPVYQWDGQKWVMAGSPLAVTPAYAQRNRICNAACQHSQENSNTAGVSNGYYAADQWAISASMGSGAISLGRVASVTPRGSLYRLRAICTVVLASIGAANYFHMFQWVEGIRIPDFRWGSASARQIVLRFGFRGPAGTYTARVANGASNRSYLKNFTISAAQANTDTEQTIVIPGDTTGTWATDNTAGLMVSVALVTGSTYLGVEGWQGGVNIFATSAISNFAATLNNTAELFDIGLYLDTTGSGIPPAWEMPDEAAELTACMRYWQKAFGIFSGNVTNGSNFYYNSVLRVPPRIGPTMNGVNQAAASFPTTAGTVNYDASGFVNEFRTATATSVGYFFTAITANARM